MPTVSAQVLGERIVEARGTFLLAPRGGVVAHARRAKHVAVSLKKARAVAADDEQYYGTI